MNEGFRFRFRFQVSKKMEREWRGKDEEEGRQGGSREGEVGGGGR